MKKTLVIFITLVVVLVGFSSNSYIKDYHRANLLMTDIKNAAVGLGHTLVLKRDGNLWGWGLNDNGQIGDGTTKDREIPVKVMDNVSSIDAIDSYSMAIKRDGTLWVWGNNIFNPSSRKITKDILKPIKIMKSVKAISAGEYNALVIKNDDSLY